MEHRIKCPYTMRKRNKIQDLSLHACTKGGHERTSQGKALTKKRHADLGHPTSRTVRDKLLVKSPRLQYLFQQPDLRQVPSMLVTGPLLLSLQRNASTLLSSMNSLL